MFKHVCPWWFGYFLIGPLRRLREKPDKFLAAYVQAGMTVLEAGPGMGFYSLPLARLVGERGKVVAVDLQEKMLRALVRRAAKAGLADRIETRRCLPESLNAADLDGRVHFATAMSMVHEVPDAARLFAELHRALIPGGLLLVSEPAIHVSARQFQAELLAAAKAGFRIQATPHLGGSRAALFAK